MKRYIELSRKYLSKRKRRAAYTLVGVALAVAFIAAIMIMFESIEISQLRALQTITGAFHGKVENISDSEVLSLDSHVLIEQLGIQRIVASLEFDGERAEVLIEEAEALMISLRGKRVVDGRLPERAGEIALDLFAVELMGITQETGQEITVEIRGKNFTFEVVGIVSTALQERRAGMAFASIFPGQSVDLAGVSEIRQNAYFTVVASGKELRATAQRVANDVEISGKTTYNGSLIYRLENQSPVNWPALILGILVAIASAVSIYNTVHISVLERIREFGLIRSAGATSAQIRRIVFRESLLISVLGIPVGLVLGILLSSLVAIYAGVEIAGLANMSVHISPLSLIIASILGFFSVVVSSFMPSIRAGRISPVEAMRQYGSKFKKKEEQTFRGSAKAHDQNLPMKLALRNMGRNIRTTVISVISMTIAATLFIGFVYFAGSFDTERLTRGVVRSEFSIRAPGIHEPGPDEETIFEISALEGVYTVAAARMLTGRMFTDIDDPSLNQQSFVVGSPEAAMRSRSGDEGGLHMGLLAYNDNGIEFMKTKLIHGRIELAELSTEPTLIIDLEYSEKYGIEVDDKVILRSYYLTQDMVRYPVDVEFTVVAIVEEFPSIAHSVAGGIIAACSEHLIGEFEPEAMPAAYSIMNLGDHYAYVDVYLEGERDDEAIAAIIENIASRFRNATFMSYLEYQTELESTLRTLSTMVYGLIAIVGFIGICGITSTVNTSLILRQREFGMLRAVGMTKRQLKTMLACEGLVFGLISAVCSVILGIVLSFSIYSLLKGDMEHLSWSLPWSGIAIAVLGLVVVGVLTTLASSKRVTSLNITEAIRTVE